MRMTFLSRKTRFEVLAVGACVAAAFLIIPPVFSTRPSTDAVLQWEADYSSLLPPGYAEFRGHWQSHDVGVRIFSFRCPDGWNPERCLQHLAHGIAQFTIHDQSPGEIAMRRPVRYSDRAGFDEFRFVSERESTRIYGMFANLDSEMDVHEALVKQLREIARQGQELEQ